MNKLTIKQAFIDKLELERSIRGWTQQEMAEKLQMSLPGYRKMVSGMTDTIALSTAYMASEIFNIPISIMCGSNKMKDRVAQKVYEASEPICRKVDYYLDLNKEMAMVYPGAQEKKIITVITLSGYMADGMYVDSYTSEKREIIDCYRPNVTKGMMITEDTFLPVYAKGDLLLLDESPARSGDIVLMMHIRTRQCYLRKMVLSQYMELHSICGRGEVIRIAPERKREWLEFGHVVTHISEDMAVQIDE